MGHHGRQLVARPGLAAVVEREVVVVVVAEDGGQFLVAFLVVPLCGRAVVGEGVGDLGVIVDQPDLFGHQALVLE